jgi:hypothetical protein
VSDAAVYQVGAEEAALGMCVPADSDAWQRAIRELVRDRARLARLRELNVAHVARAGAAGVPLWPGEAAAG